MSHTDPIADMITRIKNAVMAGKEDVNIPNSTIKVEIAKILQKNGYINKHKITKEFPSMINIELKYKGKNNNAIEDIKRISKPGKRVYASADSIPKVLAGLGIAIISTSQGLMTGKDCEKNNQGGEILLYVW